MKYSKQPHLGPLPMPLCPWSRSSILAEFQVLPCLSYAVDELILSSISGTNVRPPLQAACLQSCLWHHLLPLDLLHHLDQIHHLIFFGTIDGPLLLASSSAYTVRVWWDCHDLQLLTCPAWRCSPAPAAPWVMLEGTKVREVKQQPIDLMKREIICNCE